MSANLTIAELRASVQERRFQIPEKHKYNKNKRLPGVCGSDADFPRILAGHLQEQGGKLVTACVIAISPR
jgi:hypothetical protein